jgi:hypothetical protein
MTRYGLATWRSLALRRDAATAVLLALASAGCGDDRPATGSCSNPAALVGALPAFCLYDLNPSSPTSGQAVSPRDYLEKVSGWYFSQAT